jgi:hypothetical protein
MIKLQFRALSQSQHVSPLRHVDGLMKILSFFGITKGGALGLARRRKYPSVRAKVLG